MEEMETVQKAITAYPRVICIIQQYVHQDEKKTVANKNRIEKDIERQIKRIHKQCKISGAEGEQKIYTINLR